MGHVGHIFRPPSEAESFLLQVSLGCSHNKCTYCAMYDDPAQKFRAKPLAEVAADIETATRYATAGAVIRRVFLCDGDALVLPTNHLATILELLREKIPTVRRIGIYGDARSILHKSVPELMRLHELGLGIVYHGVESGSDEVLKRVIKGSTVQDAISAAGRLRDAGIRHSVMVMLGIGGQELSDEHARETAKALTAMDPPFVGTLTTTVVPGTPLAAAQAAGSFVLPDQWHLLGELRTILAESQFTRCRFHANHASNYLPLSLNLPADQARGLAELDRVLRLRNPADLRPEHWRGL